MASVAKKAIMKAKLNNIVTELMVKSSVDHIYMPDGVTTLQEYLGTLASSATIQEIQAVLSTLGALATKSTVSQSDLDTALATLITGKADQTALEAEINRAKAAEEANATAAANAAAAAAAVGERMTAAEGKLTTLIGDDANKSVRSIAAEELAAKLIPETAAESMNELQEIAAWIQEHPGDAATMNAAIVALEAQLKGIPAGDNAVKTYVDDAIAALKIGDYAKAADLTALAGRVTNNEAAIQALQTGKADKADTLAGYGITDAYTQEQIDKKITDAVKDATGGESAASVKADLEAYITSNDAAVSALQANSHSHDNLSVLNGITADAVAAWNAKGNIYYAAEEPASLTENDLWFQLID